MFEVGAVWMLSARDSTATAKAKKAISLYRNALGDPVGVAELLVFYCERAAGFCQEVDHRDGAHIDALARAFKRALHASGKLPGNVQNGFLTRLDRVRCIGRQLGNGVGEDMDILLSEFDLSAHARVNSGKQKFDAACRPKLLLRL